METKIRWIGIIAIAVMMLGMQAFTPAEVKAAETNVEISFVRKHPQVVVVGQVCYPCHLLLRRFGSGGILEVVVNQEASPGRDRSFDAIQVEFKVPGAFPEGVRYGSGPVKLNL